MPATLKQDLDSQTIVDTFNRYGLGSIQEGYHQIKGDVDINYKIHTQDGVFLLKYIINKKNIPQFEFLGDLHEYLKSKGMPVPKIYKTKNGKYVENNFILYEFIEGEIKEETGGVWISEEITSLSSNFANLLLVMREYEIPEFIKNKSDKYTKGSDIKYCHDELKEKILKLPTTFEIKDNIVRIINLLYSKLVDFEKLPKFLIHGDLNESNAIFKDNKNVGIIDFGIGYDPIVYDLGVFLYWFSMPWWIEEFNRERYDLICETFEEILPLSVLEKELLPYMVLRRGLMDIMLTLEWYWGESDVPVPEKRLKLLIKRNNKIISELINS